MDFGVVLQNDPPALEVVELARKAEAAGFSHVWTFDSHVLWQEPFVIYSKILDDTERVIGRGDSALRVLGLQPTTLAQLRESVGVIRGLASGEKVTLRGRELQLAWA